MSQAGSTSVMGVGMSISRLGKFLLCSHKSNIARIFPAALAMIALPTGIAAQSTEQIMIFGGNDHDVFLGCLNCTEYDQSSVWNDVGKYGWANSFGVWGRYGAYGGEFGTNSACSEFASKPPVLVDRRGAFYGYLSVNQFMSKGVCSFGGNAAVCSALKNMCSQK